MTAQLATPSVRRHLWRACLIAAAAVWWLLSAGAVSHAQDDVLPVTPAESATSSPIPVVETAAPVVDSGTAAAADAATDASQPPAQVSPGKPAAPPVAQPVTQPVTQPVRQLVQQAPEQVQPVVSEVVSPVLDSVEQAAAPSQASEAVGRSDSQANSQAVSQTNSPADSHAGSQAAPAPAVTQEERGQGGARQDGKPQTGDRRVVRTDKDAARVPDTNSAARQAARRFDRVAVSTHAPLDVRATSVLTVAESAVREAPPSEMPSSHMASDLSEERSAGTERSGSPGGAAAYLQRSSDISPLGSAARPTPQVHTPPRDRAVVPDYRPD